MNLSFLKQGSKYLGLCLFFSLCACPAPGGTSSTPTNNTPVNASPSGTTNGDVSKAQFLAQMDCLIAQGGGVASAAGASKLQAEAISDADWDSIYGNLITGASLQNMSKQATNNDCPPA